MFTGLDLFQRGGGAFLWFIPAIMIFYILYPFFLKWENKYKVYWVLLGWLLVSVALERGLGYTTIFIFTNRIPVMMAGYWYKTHKLNKWLGWVYLPIGFILLYFFGFTKRLSVPIWDIYFVVGIVSVLGLTFASGYIKENKTVSFLGSATIEMYGFQMIFGTKLSGNVYKFMGNMLPGGANLAAGTKLLSNIVTILIIWALSLACSKVFALVKNAISQKMAALK